MADNYGPGVSRVLISDSSQYLQTIWQQGKPPTDADLQLMQSLAMGAVESSVLRGMPSGFLGNETNPQRDFVTNLAWSNFYKFGPQRTGEAFPIMWANVHGWLIPVAGTRTGSPPGSPNDVDYSNIIALDPPPAAAGDFRIDFVFLEVWKARIQPSPSTTNKPGASAVYRLGNVEGGFSFLADDLVDPAIGFETNQRVQIQYRIRVVKGLVGLTLNPDGFDPVVVKAQGAAASPTSYTFTNMRQTLGDPGLWRAGDGTQNALGSVDGYSYAVPISVVFRRNGVVWNGNPSQNLNGGFNRNPTAVDRTGVKTFSTVLALAANMAVDATFLTLTSGVNLPLPATPATPVLIQVGDELMTYSSVSGSTVNIATRGVNGTLAEPHKAGVVVRLISGRPDGLFSDQIANTDILDLRHMVNPNGFDYTALLKSNLDKLLRGQLRANWKLSGTGPRGAYVHYQDVLTSSGSVSLGVTKLDAPDNIRMVFSDAATVQPIEFVCRPRSAQVSGSALPIGEDWSLGLTVNTTKQGTASAFSANDEIIIPVNQLKTSFQAGAADQVRWLNDGVLGAVSLRVDGDTEDLPSTMYTVTPANPTPTDDLKITLSATTFPTMPSSIAAPVLLHIRAYVVYGPGRGLARRPDAIHSASYLTPSADLLTQQWGIPNSNKGARVAWAPLWSRYRSAPLNGLLPVTSEVYADPGSKTIVASPFRRINFYTPVTIDGRAANLNTTAKSGTPTSGTLATGGGVVINVASTTNVAANDALVIASGPGAGRYVVISTTGTTITVERPVRATAGALTVAIYSAQGLMPLLSPAGTSKWSQTDPLKLFCGTSASTSGPTNVAFESIYVSLPRHLVPGWGEVQCPVLATSTGTFEPGINYMIRTTTSAAPTPPEESNYAAYFNGALGGNNDYQVFSQVTATLTPLAYNTATTTGAQATEGNVWAGIRFFTDTRGLGRQGLEFPPFYGVARIFGVYQASDYATKGTPFTDNRESGGTGTAVNLLRQSMAQQDGPPMWVERDTDGDATFVLNANAIDISKAPTAIAKFADGTYVVEAVVFGFDRGSFDLSSEFRLVLTRPGPNNRNSWSTVGGTPVNQTATPAGRAANIGKYVAAVAGLLPGPAEQSDQIVINYSRTVYQGDAWGSQTNNTDIPYAPGPLTSGSAYQVTSTRLDLTALTRPSQKVLEVLAATSFSTDLGTGRYVADAVTSPLDFKNVAYEDPTAYPPNSGTDARPRALAGNFAAADATNIGSEYLGCTERLPLGALFRDKDFRGQAFSNLPAPLVYSDIVGNGLATGLGIRSTSEQQEIPLNTTSSGVGMPGDILVHVDGEQTNYSLLTNYRVTRGGSIFNASGPLPGGALSLQNASVLAQTNHVNVLHGRAMLVRNAVTNVGSNEVSAGDELMMLIATTVHRPPSGTSSAAIISIGTNGIGEGYSAADLYRIEGHPLIRNNVHLQLDPASIEISKGA